MIAIHKLGLVAVACSLAVAACSGNSGGGSCSDVSGTWSSSSQVDGSACGLGTYQQSRTYVIAQTAGSCSITVTTAGVSLPGTVSGASVSWTGSYAEGSGTITLDGGALTLSQDARTLSGTLTWSYQSSTKTCAGSSAVTATKS